MESSTEGETTAVETPRERSLLGRARPRDGLAAEGDGGVRRRGTVHGAGLGFSSLGTGGGGAPPPGAASRFDFRRQERS